MKERPILFNAPMVRALLNGTKTQTRRVVKLRNGQYMPPSERKDPNGWRQMLRLCPYGKPGDRLWVRETWTQEWVRPKQGAEVFYRADGEVAPEFEPWIPSIHMFRWASRITLEIVSVRIERLQDISRGDAMAEGCPFPNMADGPDPTQWYADLWQQINGSGSGSWSANPLVWVVEFKPLILDAAA
ncbi:MAG: hypothetical protein Q8K57_13250 [Thiobacillus sp.]|nr:hypothetical protein [Thiobacillus sp.]